MHLHKARQAQKARRIIREAFGITRAGARLPVRYELLGNSVALAVVRQKAANAPVVIKVARELPNGRVSRMLKECRSGFLNVGDQIRYFESLYERFGEPK